MPQGLNQNGSITLTLPQHSTAKIYVKFTKGSVNGSVRSVAIEGNDVGNNKFLTSCAAGNGYEHLPDIVWTTHTINASSGQLIYHITPMHKNQQCENGPGDISLSNPIVNGPFRFIRDTPINSHTLCFYRYVHQFDSQTHYIDIIIELENDGSGGNANDLRVKR